MSKPAASVQGPAKLSQNLGAPRIDPWGADQVFEDAEGDGDRDFCPDDTSGWTARNDQNVDHGREMKAHDV